MDETTLYQENVRTVYGFFVAKTFNQSLAEDLTHEVFTTAFEQYRNPAKHIEDKQKYLYGVMKLTWTQYLRRKYQNAEHSVEDIDDFSEYAEETIQAVKEQSIIDRALPYIKQLPDKQQQVMLLRFRDGLSLKEICQQLNCDMNYVKTTQKRGLASLKQLVNEGVTS
jgi:RNA polymerase sigma-70 factor (ECF subfamily)